MRLTGGTHLGWLGSGWLNNAGLDWTGDRNHRPLVVPHHQAEAEAEAEAAIRFPHSLAAAARQISPASPPRLRCSILTHLISSPSASPASQLHRLISAAAASGVSPAATPAFAVEEYLVSTCGLTRAQALKGSTKLSHLKSPAKPDAVLALLAGADIAAVVAKDPQLLCAKEEKTLGPNVVGLTGLGLSPSEIARLVSLGPDKFRRRSIVSTLEYCLPLFGSSHNLLRAARCNAALLDLNPERTAKPNVTLLQECGLGACDIAKLCRNSPWLLTTNLQRLRSMLALAEGLGVPRGSGMFRQALRAVGLQSEETITAKVEFLKKTFRLSDAEVRSALSKSPMVLTRSKDMLQHVSEFLISEVGLEPTYIAHLSVMLTYSLEGRLRPRYDVLKFLKENRLLKRDLGYSTVFKETEKIFRDKFICPHKGCTTPRRRL